MKTLCIACGLLVATWVLPASLFAQNSRSALQAQSAESGPRRTVGAPQVLEIPVPQADPQTDSYQDVYQDSQDSYQDPYQDPYQDSAQPGQNQGYDPYGMPQQAAIPPEQTQAYAEAYGGKRTYLGVLYATAEQGPPGVKVLSLVPDSPAYRAGFIGANAPEEEGSDLLRAAIVVLAMSPAGPFAIPLAIAHDMYTNRDTPGDLIVSINNTPTPDAQEFTEVMRQYKPGDNVSFSIVRAGKPMQISVRLEEEPL